MNSSSFIDALQSPPDAAHATRAWLPWCVSALRDGLNGKAQLDAGHELARQLWKNPGQDAERVEALWQLHVAESLRASAPAERRMPADVVYQRVAEGIRREMPFVGQRSRGEFMDVALALLPELAESGIREQGKASLRMPLLFTEGRGAVIGWLRLEKRWGDGRLRRALSMAWVRCDRDWEKAEAAARATVAHLGLWPARGSEFDVTWEITRADGGEVWHLTGPSAGAAFAISLAKLLGGSAEPWASLELDGAAVTAGITEEGDLTPVGEVAVKLAGSARDRSVLPRISVIGLAKEQWERWVGGAPASPQGEGARPADRETEEARRCFPGLEPFLWDKHGQEVVGVKEKDREFFLAGASNLTHLARRLTELARKRGLEQIEAGDVPPVDEDFCPRDEVTHLLDTHIEQLTTAERGRRGGAIALIGEAGAGKTTFLADRVRRLRRQGREPVSFFVGRGLKTSADNIARSLYRQLRLKWRQPGEAETIKLEGESLWKKLRDLMRRISEECLSGEGGNASEVIYVDGPDHAQLDRVLWPGLADAQHPPRGFVFVFSSGREVAAWCATNANLTVIDFATARIVESAKERATQPGADAGYRDAIHRYLSLPKWRALGVDVPKEQQKAILSGTAAPAFAVVAHNLKRLEVGTEREKAALLSAAPDALTRLWWRRSADPAAPKWWNNVLAPGKWVAALAVAGVLNAMLLNASRKATEKWEALETLRMADEIHKVAIQEKWGQWMNGSFGFGLWQVQSRIASANRIREDALKERMSKLTGRLDQLHITGSESARFKYRLQWALGRWEDALTVLRTWVAEEKDESELASLLHGEVVLLGNVSRWKEALEQSEKELELIKRLGSEASAWEDRMDHARLTHAVCLVNVGKHKEALAEVEEFKKHRQAKPRPDEVWMSWQVHLALLEAKCRVALGELKTASGVLETVLETPVRKWQESDDEVLVRFMLAEIMFDEGHYQDGIEHAEKANELIHREHDCKGRCAMGMRAIQLRAEGLWLFSEAPEAVKLLREALENVSGEPYRDAYAAAMLAIDFANIADEPGMEARTPGVLGEAERGLESAREFFEKDGAAYRSQLIQVAIRLAEIHHIRGEWKEEIEELKKARERNQNAEDEALILLSLVTAHEIDAQSKREAGSDDEADEARRERADVLEAVRRLPDSMILKPSVFPEYAKWLLSRFEQEPDLAGVLEELCERILEQPSVPESLVAPIKRSAKIHLVVALMHQAKYRDAVKVLEPLCSTPLTAEFEMTEGRRKKLDGMLKLTFEGLLAQAYFASGEEGAQGKATQLVRKVYQEIAGGDDRPEFMERMGIPLKIPWTICHEMGLILEGEKDVASALVAHRKAMKLMTRLDGDARRCRARSGFEIAKCLVLLEEAAPGGGGPSAYLEAEHLLQSALQVFKQVPPLRNDYRNDWVQSGEQAEALLGKVQTRLGGGVTPGNGTREAGK